MQCVWEGFSPCFRWQLGLLTKRMMTGAQRSRSRQKVWPVIAVAVAVAVAFLFAVGFHNFYKIRANMGEMICGKNLHGIVFELDRYSIEHKVSTEEIFQQTKGLITNRQFMIKL